MSCNKIFTKQISVFSYSVKATTLPSFITLVNLVVCCISKLKNNLNVLHNCSAMIVTATFTTVKGNRPQPASFYFQGGSTQLENVAQNSKSMAWIYCIAVHSCKLARGNLFPCEQSLIKSVKFEWPLSWWHSSAQHGKTYMHEHLEHLRWAKTDTKK